MTQEYVTDVPYVRGFEKSLSPLQLRLCAALNGFRPPPQDDFDYCELGCAQGDTTVALAVGFPHARFVGVDLNEAHITTARTLALGGEVKNVSFLERDFEALGEGDSHASTTSSPTASSAGSAPRSARSSSTSSRDS